MKTAITKLIQVDASLAIPVYKQIVQSICRGIENGTLVKDDVLPSVNKISETFSLARGSVFTAYNDLRASGIIDSIPGKGYFVSSTETRLTKRIFLLFNTFTQYKENLFNALLNNLPKSCVLDIYFHQHDIKIFERLIRDQAGYYNIFIIMPEVNTDTMNILSTLGTKKIYLLDVGYREYKKDYPGVFQNFEKDIYSILASNQHLVTRYKRLFIIIPEEVGTKNIISGFNKFGKKNLLTTGIRKNADPADIRKGDAFIVTEDRDLVEIVKHAKVKKWELGKDIGLISYNENELKSVIGNGITTIATDFEAMGKSMADLIVSGKREVIENPFIMIDRKSF